MRLLSTEPTTAKINSGVGGHPCQLGVDKMHLQTKPNSIEHCVLKALKFSDGKTLEAIHLSVLELVSEMRLSDLCIRYLAIMQMNDLIVVSNNRYQLSLVGYGVLTFIDKQPESDTEPSIAGPVCYQGKGTYTGEGMKDSVARKGAYDYLNLPSRFGNELTMPVNNHE